MKVVPKQRKAKPDASQRMLMATPTVGKAILMAGFALIFAVVLLVSEVRWALDDRTFGTTQWVFALVTIALLVAAIWLGRRIPRSLKLEREGETVEGRVIGGWRETDEDSESFYLAFAAGELTFKQQVGRKRYRAYEPGDQVSVIQLREQPEIARILFP